MGVLLLRWMLPRGSAGEGVPEEWMDGREKGGQETPASCAWSMLMVGAHWARMAGGRVALPLPPVARFSVGRTDVLH